MYEKILVPLDGANAAEIVLPYAEEIAAKVGAEIILAYVSESGARAAGPYLERIMIQVQRQLIQWDGKKKITVRSETLHGKPVNGILRYADEANVGLIVMAAHGSSNQGRSLLENIAAKVLRATSKPMLLVKSAAGNIALQEKRLVKKILVPLDGTSAGETAIPYAAALAQALNAELVLLQIVEPPAVRPPLMYEHPVTFATPRTMERAKTSALAYLDSTAKRLSESAPSISTAADIGTPVDQIIEYAKANSVDLVAISTHGRSGIGRWVSGSVTDRVLSTGHTQVLAVRMIENQPNPMTVDF